VGHVLGFGHPDAEPSRNLVLPNGVRMDNVTCSLPLDHVQLEPPISAETNRDTSVMFSVTKHRDRTCLTDDDLDGLNFLYPSCSAFRTSPICQKQPQLLGYIRLAIAAAVPFVGSTAFVMLLLTCVRWERKREMGLLRNARRKSKVRNRWKRASLRATLNARRSSWGIGLPGTHAPQKLTSRPVVGPQSIFSVLKQHSKLARKNTAQPNHHTKGAGRPDSRCGGRPNYKPRTQTGANTSLGTACAVTPQIQDTTHHHTTTGHRGHRRVSSKEAHTQANRCELEV